MAHATSKKPVCGTTSQWHDAKIPFKRPLGESTYSSVAALTWQRQVADLLSGSCQRDRVTERTDICNVSDTQLQ